MIGAAKKMEQDLSAWARDLYMHLFDLRAPDTETLDPICRLPTDQSVPVVLEFIARTDRYGIQDELPDLFFRVDARYRALGLESEGGKFFLEFGRTVQELSESHHLDREFAAYMMGSMQQYIRIDWGDLKFGQIFVIPQVKEPLPTGD